MSTSRPSKSVSCTYPQGSWGVVYVELTSAEPVHDVEVTLNWGRRRHVSTIETVDRLGVALVFVQYHDEIALLVETSAPVVITIGRDMPPRDDDGVLDYAEGWENVS